MYGVILHIYSLPTSPIHIPHLIRLSELELELGKAGWMKCTDYVGNLLLHFDYCFFSSASTTV